MLLLGSISSMRKVSPPGKRDTVKCEDEQLNIIFEREPYGI